MSPSTEFHIWHRCHGCGAAPIIGTRYDCLTCPTGQDNHLCNSCHDAYGRGHLKHPADNSFAACSMPDVGPHVFKSANGSPCELYERWLTGSDRVEAPPSVCDGFVVRPEFCAGAGSFLGSYAHIVQISAFNSPLVMTALHVLDQLARTLNIDLSIDNLSYSGTELPRAIDQVHLYDVFASNWMRAPLGSARPMLVLRDARIGELEPSCQRDIAAFLLDTPQPCRQPHRLAASQPKIGQSIWLAAARAGGQITRTVPATVVESSDGALIFRYADPSEPPRHTSGAPLLDAMGHVVGINIGGGQFAGRHFGHAIHVTSVRRHLSDAKQA